LDSIRETEGEKQKLGRIKGWHQQNNIMETNKWVNKEDGSGSDSKKQKKTPEGTGYKEWKGE